MDESLANATTRPRKGHEMGFLDNAKEQLTKAVDQHGDKIAEGMDKAADALDKRTGGKHQDKIQQGRVKAQEALDKLDGKDDDFPKGSSGSR
jgi:hypothetical protein